MDTHCGSHLYDLYDRNLVLGRKTRKKKPRTNIKIETGMMLSFPQSVSLHGREHIH